MSTTPWTVKIESTEGCNRSCMFCPVPKIYGKVYKFLTVEVAARIVDQLLEWESEREWRFELAMFGEPTMNKQMANILQQLRRIRRAQITMFTNGDIIKSNFHLMETLFNSGLNVLGVDCYDAVNLGFFSTCQLPDGITRWNYFDNGYKLYAKKKNGYRLKDVVIINDLATMQNIRTVRKMHNFGGNVDNSIFGIPDLKEPIKAGCEKPFRDLVISHAGDVLICCLDANKDLKVGNIYTSTLKEIWYGEKYMDIRRSLANSERIGRPCDTCSYFGGHKRFLAVNDFKQLL